MAPERHQVHSGFRTQHSALITHHWLFRMTVPIITLLTDFGLEDTYVASMKGVILEGCPNARLVDVSHLVPPQDVCAGAYLLASCYRDFPPGTIHLAVVDPGVGTDRRGLVLKADHYYFVGPDNGLFSWVLHEAAVWEAYSLERTEFWRATVSKTFHGRDIFAPVAAHLGMGVPVQAFGPPCTPKLAPWTDATQTGAEILGQIIHIDHFGNAVTNVTRTTLERFASPSSLAVGIGGLTLVPIVETYGDQETGRVVALIGSSNRLEIAVNQGHAAKTCGIRRGDPVSVVRMEETSDE
jgi:S-adenosyl-L-methionine hydrolase (adenosine-forming)